MNKNQSLSSRLAQRGYGLLEAMLVAAVIVIGIAGIYRFYQQVYAAEAAHAESQNVLEITNRVVKAYGAAANFGALDNTSVINEGILPANMPIDAGIIRSAFGGNVVVTGETIDGIAGRGFSITYSEVPRKLCPTLVASVNKMQRFRSISVRSGGADGGGAESVVAEEGAINEADVAEACGRGNTATVSFLFERNSAGDMASMVPCVVPSPATENRSIACENPAYVGVINQTRTGSCPDYYGLPSFTPWAEVSNNCVLRCVPLAPEESTAREVCPTGYGGVITHRRVSSCADERSTPQWSTWTEISRDCQPLCVVPAEEETVEPCPAGQAGEIRHKRTATCPAATGSPSWGPFVEISNTCMPLCVVPNPSTQTRWMDASGACGAGYSGTRAWQYEETRTGSCPQLTGSVAWTSWVSTGQQRNENRSACVSLCNPEPVLERWASRTGTCAAGYVGNRTWEERESRTSTCEPGASAPVTSAWVATGETRNMNDSCTPSPCTITSSVSRTWTVGGRTCSSTHAGNVIINSGNSLTLADSTQPLTGAANYQCTNGTLSSTANGGATCNVTACSVAANTTFNWSVGGAACTFTTSSSSIVAVGDDVDASDTTQPTTGGASFVCLSSGSISATPNAGFTCVGQCPAQPAADTRTFAGCAAGQYGSWSQSNPYENAAYPSCWAQTNNTWLPAAAPAGACTSCPAATNESETQWVSRSAACPAGYTGSNTWEAQQSRSRTVTYSCPAGTAALPSPTYGTWGGWSDTGTTRNVSNTCAPASCTIAAGTTRTWTVGGQSCSATLTAGTIASGSTRGATDSTQPVTGGAQFQCTNGTLATTPNAGATCAISSCSVAAGTTFNWSVGGAACTFTTSSASMIAVNSTLTASDATQPTTGGATFTCPTTGVINTTPNAGATCVGQCPAAPAADTRVHNGCAAGQYGSWPQSNPYEASAFPTCWAQTTANWTPATAPAGACTNCPAPSSETETQWVSTGGSCPAGQYGSRSWEVQQTRSRSVTYSCPAGGTALPAPTYGTWGGWTNTANTRNVVNNCTTCPANTTQSETQWVNRNAACPAGYLGSNTWQAEQRRSQTVTYSCPAGTATAPSPVYGGYGGWADTGATRNVVNTCAAACVVPTPSTERRYQTVPELRQFACPAGQYGPNPGAIDEWRNHDQYSDRTAYCPASTGAYAWGAWGGWITYNTSAWVRTADRCNNCPGASTEYTTQWVNRSAACPAGYTGSQTWQAEQSASRSVSYSCPAGSTSIPGPTYGGWSGWGDTGNTRNFVNGCVVACTPSSYTQVDSQYDHCTPTGRKLCEFSTRSRSVTITCPGPVTTYGTWSAATGGQCVATNRMCP